MKYSKEELQEMLNEHKEYLETSGMKGKQLYLEFVDLTDADLRYANLRDADLRYADLRDAHLRGANLRGADLTDADLTDANLRDADLRYADLRDAHLTGADLKDADLTDANLRGVNLRNADLKGVDLRNTDLTNANLKGANLKGVDLDYSSFPLWCGGLNIQTDARIMRQIAYHFCKQDCDDEEYIEARNAILDFANKFHRVDECGKLEPR